MGIIPELYVEGAVGQDGQVHITDSNEATGRKWGAVDLTNPLAVLGALKIANGGTGQATPTDAFNALDPLTTKGDVIVHDGTNSVRHPVGANGTVLLSDSTAADGVAWSTTILGLLTGGFRHAGGSGITAVKIAGQLGSTALTTTAAVANTLYAVPLVESVAGGTINKIWVEVTTGAAKSSVRIGIYKATSGTNLYPAALVFDSGALSGAAAAVLSSVAGAVLVPGTLYWLVFVSDSTPTIRTLPVAGAYPIFGIGTGFGANMQVGLNVAFTFGALVDPFPVLATPITTGFLPALGADFNA